MQYQFDKAEEKKEVKPFFTLEEIDSLYEQSRSGYGPGYVQMKLNSKVAPLLEENERLRMELASILREAREFVAFGLEYSETQSLEAQNLIKRIDVALGEKE